MDVPADYSDKVATHHVSDPLVSELCASTGPPIWVDPMLEEFIASIAVSRPAGATAT
jgi:hypothetical protein